MITFFLQKLQRPNLQFGPKILLFGETELGIRSPHFLQFRPLFRSVSACFGYCSGFSQTLCISVMYFLCFGSCFDLFRSGIAPVSACFCLEQAVSALDSPCFKTKGRPNWGFGLHDFCKKKKKSYCFPKINLVNYDL